MGGMISILIERKIAVYYVDTFSILKALVWKLAVKSRKRQKPYCQTLFAVCFPSNTGFLSLFDSEAIE